MPHTTAIRLAYFLATHPHRKESNTEPRVFIVEMYYNGAMVREWDPDTQSTASQVWLISNQQVWILAPSRSKQCNKTRNSESTVQVTASCSQANHSLPGSGGSVVWDPGIDQQLDHIRVPPR
jgi:hypothetical protein